MAKSVLIFITFMVATIATFAQSSINDYKYIIIPDQFEFLNESDKYQLNSLTKFLFNKYGYKAYMRDEVLPQELQSNRCLGLTSDVIKESAFLKTKLRIDLKDCNGSVIYSSKVGETREKDFDKAYKLALREAFETFQNLDYKYQPNERMLAKYQIDPASATARANEEDEIAKLKEEIKTLKEEQAPNVEVEQPIADIEKKTNAKTEVMSTQPVDITKEKLETTSGVLYAQPIDNGFQIVDTTPKKVMILRESGVENVFKVEGTKAIVYKKGDDWMYSESGDIFKGYVINIKF